MANNLSGNPVRIDTFGADRTVSDSAVKLSSLVVTARAARNCVFIDADGAVVLDLAVAANSTVVVPGPLFFDSGLTFDESGSSMAANDTIVAFIDKQ